MPKSSQPTQAPSNSPESRSIPRKCLVCATLSANDAKARHGSEGDGCWNPRLCPSRRSYIRNRDKRNAARRKQVAQITIEPDTVVFSAVLVVYRRGGTDSPVHAIAGEIWKGEELEATVTPVHCAGMLPSQVHGYIEKMLDVLDQRYGISRRKFASLKQLDPSLCPCGQVAPRYGELV